MVLGFVLNSSFDRWARNKQLTAQSYKLFKKFKNVRRPGVPVRSLHECARLRRPPEPDDGLLRPRHGLRGLQLGRGPPASEGQRREVLSGRRSPREPEPVLRGHGTQHAARL